MIGGLYDNRAWRALPGVGRTLCPAAKKCTDCREPPSICILQRPVRNTLYVIRITYVRVYMYVCTYVRVYMYDTYYICVYNNVKGIHIPSGCNDAITVNIIKLITLYYPSRLLISS